MLNRPHIEIQPYSVFHVEISRFSNRIVQTPFIILLKIPMLKQSYNHTDLFYEHTYFMNHTDLFIL